MLHMPQHRGQQLAGLSAAKGLIMARRSKRTGFLHPKQELEKLRSAREMLIAVHIHYPIHSDAYQRAGEALKAIDDLAEALSGDHGYFLKPRV
jgi:glutamine phosphoribosylpyrophosphate amidotransferase